MDNIFQIIEIIEEDKFTAEFESVKAEILESLPDDSEDISFESIIKGDNVVKSTLSKIFKNILNFDPKSKIEFDNDVFKKIDKSKISKDVTGVATPEYVKTFCDIMTANLLSSTDANRLAYLLTKFKEGYFDDKLKSKVNILFSSSIISYLASVTSLFTIGFGHISSAFLLIEMLCVISMFVVISDAYKYKGSVTIDEINEIIDLISKLLNAYVNNGNTTTIDSESYKSAERLIAQLKAPAATTITVADQNKVADMLSTLAVNNNKTNIIGSSRAKYLASVSQTVKILMNNDIQADANLLGKIEGINRLANHALLLTKAIAEASNTIMRDIRKW